MVSVDIKHYVYMLLIFYCLLQFVSVFLLEIWYVLFVTLESVCLVITGSGPRAALQKRQLLLKYPRLTVRLAVMPIACLCLLLVHYMLVYLLPVLHQICSREN